MMVLGGPGFDGRAAVGGRAGLGGAARAPGTATGGNEAPRAGCVPPDRARHSGGLKCSTG